MNKKEIIIIFVMLMAFLSRFLRINWFWILFKSLYLLISFLR